MGNPGLTVTYAQVWGEGCESRACAGKGRRHDTEDKRTGLSTLWF